MATRRKSHITWLMPLATAAQFFLPRWLLLPVVHLAGILAYRFNHGQRNRLIENYRHIFGPDAPKELLKRTARQAFINLAIGYMDLLRTPVLKKRVTSLADFDLTHLDKVLAKGKGVVLVTGHLGNWDLAGVFMTAQGYPLSAVVEPIPAGWTKTFNRYRSVTNMETIPIPDRRAITSAIHRHRLLTLVADRDLTGHGILCPSFDAYRSFPKGPAAYALKHRLPILIGYFVFQNRPGHPPYTGIVEPPLQFEPSGSLSADIDNFTRLIASHLNRIISRYPDQWLVFRAGWLETGTDRDVTAKNRE